MFLVNEPNYLISRPLISAYTYSIGTVIVCLSAKSAPEVRVRRPGRNDQLSAAVTDIRRVLIDMLQRDPASAV